MNRIHIYDTTLRDGSQLEGISLTVDDKSNEHNFHLSGRAVNKATSPASVSTSTWRVRFVRGTYRFACDPHAGEMRGSLRVV
jgi:isopropylmalate/homocitrate/citramalate synthase